MATPLPFTSPPGTRPTIAPPTRVRSDLMAYLLEQNKPDDMIANPPSSVGEGLARTAGVGLDALMAKKVAAQTRADATARNQALADALFPMGEGAVSDPRREMVAQILETGAVDPSVFAPSIAKNLGFGEPPSAPTIHEAIHPETGRKAYVQWTGGTQDYGFGPGWAPLGGSETDVMSPEAEEQKVRIATASKPETVINTGETAEGALAKSLGTEVAKDLVTRRAVANDSALSLQASAEARKLLDSGVVTGFGADWLVGFGKALQQAGVNMADDAIANTEAFVATRAQEVGRIIKLFGAGTGLSDADREFATKAAAGQITLNEASIRRILDINDKAARNIIANFNKDASAIDAQKLVPFPLAIQVPESQAAPIAAPAGNAPEPGTVEDGYRFKGGDPADPANWEKVSQ